MRPTALSAGLPALLVVAAVACAQEVPAPVEVSRLPLTVCEPVAHPQFPDDPACAITCLAAIPEGNRVSDLVEHEGGLLVVLGDDPRRRRLARVDLATGALEVLASAFDRDQLALARVGGDTYVSHCRDGSRMPCTIYRLEGAAPTPVGEGLLVAGDGGAMVVVRRVGDEGEQVDALIHRDADGVETILDADVPGGATQLRGILAGDGAWFYVTVGGQLRRATPGGAAPVLLAGGMSDVLLAGDGQLLVARNADAMRLPASGGLAELVFDGTPTGTSVGSLRQAWRVGDDVLLRGDGGIVRLRTAEHGTTVEMLLEGDVNQATVLADRIVWVHERGAGAYTLAGMSLDCPGAVTP